MRFEQLKYFIRIVECRSFNKAASQLFITQPALSHAASQLEKELGITLLTRDRKGVIPTPEGLRVYEDACALTQAFEDKIREWKSLGACAVQGIVMLQALPTICSFISGNLEQRLRAAFPDISLALIEKTFEEFYEALRDGRCRIALIALPHSIERETLEPYRRMGFEAEALMEDEYELFLSASHPLARREYVNPEDMPELEYVTYSSEAIKSTAFFSYLQKQLQLKRVKYASSRESILALIAENSGVTLWLGAMMRSNIHVRQGRIVGKKLAGAPLVPSRHYLLYRPQAMLSQPEIAVIDFLKHHYAQSQDIS